MTSQKFTTTITKMGSKVGIALPFNPDVAWGSKERHYIRGTVNDCMVRGPLVDTDKGYILSLGPAWRRDNGLEVGDVVEVVLSAEGPQMGTLSPDIAAALAEEPEATAFFDSLATFYRKNFIRWIESAKRPETRQGRIREMVDLLKEGKKQR